MWGGGKRGTLDREVLIQEVIRAVNAHDSLYSLHGQSGVDRLASIEQQRRTEEGDGECGAAAA